MGGLDPQSVGTDGTRFARQPGTQGPRGNGRVASCDHELSFFFLHEDASVPLSHSFQKEHEAKTQVSCSWRPVS